ncbi:hypothetical protein PNH38_13270 [Anoxybacillus rupiensis]|uniref:Uncharacterized protein n=1 Tax=Anoxybacteroides rupiense TaxID=311460 RepID=A0ABT5W7L9_9BACL|nr:hypothetical protein [Anoxybacillus rupiensis]
MEAKEHAAAFLPSTGIDEQSLSRNKTVYLRIHSLLFLEIKVGSLCLTIVKKPII